MAGIKCPRLGLAQTGIWREILMTSLCSRFRFGLAPAGLSPGGQQEQTKEFQVISLFHGLQLCVFSGDFYTKMQYYISSICVLFLQHDFF